MTVSKLQAEKHILLFSVVAAVGFAFLGFIWGFLIDSQMLIFDGIYSFISVILSAISLYVSDLLRKEDDDQFQFGRAQIEPLAIFFKSLAIFSICLYAFITAIIDMLNGGSNTNIESAIVYSVVATLACLASWLYISWQTKRVKASGLLMVEKQQWLMDTLLSSAVLVGFVIGYLLKSTEYSYLVKYVDSAMVILATSYFFKMPIEALKNSLKELMLMAPEPDAKVSIEVERICQQIRQKYGFDEVVSRIAKTGRELSLELSFIGHDPQFALNLGQLDAIRDELDGQLSANIPLKLWLTVSFMHSKKHS
ncbi:cation transporter [Neiella sp. HB171785]|uniref:Cation transporter n=1 Tax=Neiella litorisoli TaxID=2771431 RepID=A0A8J6R1S0_9GAMM|nr:cation transporter [Neiella litorisoli]MBD1388135.1 cation transporter [Neiella litorisoli]